MKREEIVDEYKKLVKIEKCFKGMITNVKSYLDGSKVITINGYNVIGFEVDGNFEKSRNLKLIVSENVSEPDTASEHSLPFALVSMRVLEYVLSQIEKE